MRAKVWIAGTEMESKVKPGSKAIGFEMDLPAGKTKLETWLFDEQNEAGGAYFTEVELLTAAVKKKVGEDQGTQRRRSGDRDVWRISRRMV